MTTPPSNKSSNKDGAPHGQGASEIPRSLTISFPKTQTIQNLHEWYRLTLRPIKLTRSHPTRRTVMGGIGSVYE